MVPGIDKFKIKRMFPALVQNMPVLSIKIHSPLSIEEFDRYEVIALCQVTDPAVSQPILVEVHLVPRALSRPGSLLIMAKEGDTPYEDNAFPDATLTPVFLGTRLVRINVGIEVEDGSWHLIVVDLDKAIANALPTNTLNGILGIVLAGNQYRADDIKLMTKAIAYRRSLHPFFFHIGDIYTQLFDPRGTVRYVFASSIVGDRMLPTDANRYKDNIRCRCLLQQVNYGNTVSEAMLTIGQGENLNDKIADINSKQWIDYMKEGVRELGYNIEQNLTWQQYRDAVIALDITLATRTPSKSLAQIRIENPNIPITIRIGAGVAGLADIRIPAFYLYAINVPNLIDPTMAYGPDSADGGNNMLNFTAYVGGPHERGIPFNNIENLPLVGVPQPKYYPLYLQSSLSGRGYLDEGEIELTRQALLQAGYTHWPTIAALKIEPEQIIENLVLSVVASNGLSEDWNSLHVYTVNYPVTNYPPIIHDPEVTAHGYVGQTFKYQCSATDPDSYTIDLAHFIQGSGDFADDMEQLTWKATLDRQQVYAYGPWIEPVIDQKEGIISFEPLFEGRYKCTVFVRDPYGAETTVSFPIIVTNPGTWLNHPPILLDGWDNPMLASAGELITWRFGDCIDPDGEPIAYSCNLGAIGLIGGEQMWTFQTEIPGDYLLEIVAYDTRGGYLVMNQAVIITPWWSQSINERGSSGVSPSSNWPSYSNGYSTGSEGLLCDKFYAE